MAKFSFALEPLLKARRLHEQNFQRALAEIERERLAFEEQLRTQQRVIAQGRQTLQSSLIGKVDTHSLRMHAAVSIHMERTAQRIVMELACVHRRIEAVRAQLIEAARRRRVVELLRERRFAQWKAKLDKAETDVLDELAVIAASRQPK